MLIEALIALLIFSMGILGIVGLQASAVKASTDAKYRSEASLLANELIGKMWVSNRTPGTLQTDFSSPSGAAYQTWAWGGAGATGTKLTPATGTVVQILPGAQANPPTVSITPTGSASLPSSTVSVTIFWQAPSETTTHNHVVIAQIGT